LERRRPRHSHPEANQAEYARLQSQSCDLQQCLTRLYKNCQLTLSDGMSSRWRPAPQRSMKTKRSPAQRSRAEAAPFHPILSIRALFHNALTGVVSPLGGRSYGTLSDQVTTEMTHVPPCFRMILRWFPTDRLGVESSAEENVVL
jgi:hypothetical protein